MVSMLHVMEPLLCPPLPSLLSWLIPNNDQAPLTCCIMVLENSSQIGSITSLRSRSKCYLSRELSLTMQFTRALLTIFPLTLHYFY